MENKKLTEKQKKQLRLRTLSALYTFEEDYLADALEAVVGLDDDSAWQEARQFVRMYIERIHRRMGFEQF